MQTITLKDRELLNAFNKLESAVIQLRERKEVFWSPGNKFEKAKDLLRKKLKNGGNPNIATFVRRDERRITLLERAINLENSAIRIEIVELLLKHGAGNGDNADQDLATEAICGMLKDPNLFHLVTTIDIKGFKKENINRIRDAVDSLSLQDKHGTKKTFIKNLSKVNDWLFKSSHDAPDHDTYGEEERLIQKKKRHKTIKASLVSQAFRSLNVRQ